MRYQQKFGYLTISRVDDRVIEFEMDDDEDIITDDFKPEEAELIWLFLGRLLKKEV